MFVGQGRPSRFITQIRSGFLLLIPASGIVADGPFGGPTVENGN